METLLRCPRAITRLKYIIGYNLLLTILQQFSRISSLKTGIINDRSLRLVLYVGRHLFQTRFNSCFSTKLTFSKLFYAKFLISLPSI